MTELATIQNDLAGSLDKQWDADDSFDPQVVWDSPLGKLVKSLAAKPGSVNALALITLEKTGELWRLMNRTAELSKIIDVGKRVADKGVSLESVRGDLDCIQELDSFEPLDVNPVMIGALRAVLEDYRSFVLTGNDVHVVYLLSNVAIAYEHSPMLESFSFRKWLAFDALPHAWESAAP